MNNKAVSGLAVTALGTALVLATPAAAFRGGFGGFGGMHGGMHMGGMHMGGMHMGGMHMGGMHMGGMPGGGMHFARPGGMFAGRSVFVPGGNRFVRGPFARPVFAHRFNRFAFRHHRFHRFAFVGAPLIYASYASGCWRRAWTPYGWEWINVCYGYGY
jgi:hypothetical protein